MPNEMSQSLLAAGDPPPVTVHNENGLDVVSCEGRALGPLGALFARFDNCGAKVLFEAAAGRFF